MLTVQVSATDFTIDVRGLDKLVVDVSFAGNHTDLVELVKELQEGCELAGRIMPLMAPGGGPKPTVPEVTDKVETIVPEPAIVPSEISTPLSDIEETTPGPVVRKLPTLTLPVKK